MNYQSIPVTHYAQNCSLLWCDKTHHGALIDPGGDPERIRQAIVENAVKVEKILLTHGHLDHVGATAEMATDLGVPIIGPHRDDAFWIDILDTQADMMGFQKVQAFTPSQWLQDGDEVTVGELVLHVLHCPGHTPGHVVFFEPKARKAFVGDVLFHGSIGRTDFPKGNHEQLLQSIRQKLWPLGGDVSFVPGHGPESTFAHEQAHNPFVADHRFG